MSDIYQRIIINKKKYLFEKESFCNNCFEQNNMIHTISKCSLFQTEKNLLIKNLKISKFDDNTIDILSSIHNPKFVEAKKFINYLLKILEKIESLL